MKLDEKGRCCGRKPLFYKGGSWRSPPGSPMKVCCDCNREYDPLTGEQRANWAWILDAGGFWVRRPPERSAPALPPETAYPPRQDGKPAHWPFPEKRVIDFLRKHPGKPVPESTE